MEGQLGASVGSDESPRKWSVEGQWGSLARIRDGDHRKVQWKDNRAIFTFAFE